MVALKKGRQHSNSDKMLLLQNHLGLKCDAYFLRFPVGSMIPPRQDSVQYGQHFQVEYRD